MRVYGHLKWYELFNYLLTGYNPEEKFTRTRVNLLEELTEINKHQLRELKTEQLDEEKIEAFAKRITQSCTSALLSDGIDIPQFEGATPIVEEACLMVTGTKYNPEAVIWLHKVVGYGILLH